ncbi:hypothetical protein RCL1_000071 [Eukaryota sp. TZLM3-RCL]
MITHVNNQTILPAMKAKIIELCFPQFLRWFLQVHEISITFIDEEISPLLTKALKSWLGITKTANVDYLFLPRSEGGLGFPDLSLLYKECQLQKFHILKNSSDPDILKLYDILSSRRLLWKRKWNSIACLDKFCKKNILVEDASKSTERRKIIELFKRDEINKRIESFHSCQLQSSMTRSVLQSSIMDTDYHWMSMLVDLSPSILKFAINSSLNVLPTADNLFRWKISRRMPNGSKLLSATCSLCESSPATLSHILASCPSYQNPENVNRPAFRHDAVLSLFVDKLTPYLEQYELYCDLPNHSRYYVNFPLINSDLRPDLILVSKVANSTNRKSIILGELTCPMEEYLDARHAYKSGKYHRLEMILSGLNYVVESFAFEVSARGIVANSCTEFMKRLLIPKEIIPSISKELAQMSLRCSYRIFCARENKLWNSYVDV